MQVDDLDKAVPITGPRLHPSRRWHSLDTGRSIQGPPGRGMTTSKSADAEYEGAATGAEHVQRLVRYIGNEKFIDRRIHVGDIKIHKWSCCSRARHCDSGDADQRFVGVSG